MITERERRRLRCSMLVNERQSWMQHWREISEYQQPRLGRFFITDVNKGEKRHNKIHDSAALLGARTLAAGMMSGGTSPARPWFKLALADKELMSKQPVKAWLFKSTTLLLSIFAKSNTYRALHQMYTELGLFGTSCTAVLPNYDNVIHHYPMTAGEYALATNSLGVVDTVCREFQMTVGQIVQQFGLDNCSTTIKTLYDRGNLDAWVPVTHLIEPNTKRDPSKLDNRNMRFSAVYMETQSNEEKYLQESGFKTFAALAPRWEVTGNDVYGNSPGMEALGDVKQLQHQQFRKSQAIDYQTNPPIQVPTSYKDAASARLPGGVMYVDSASPTGGIRSAFEVNLNLQHLREDIADVRERIRQAYYVDLFQMLANDTRSGVTATEIAERHEEKLLMLGPVLERLHNELLTPLINITFERAADANILPPAPPELEGVDLNIEFISTLAQAQRIVSAQGTDRLLGTIGQIASIKPEVIDKVDFDQVIDDYADLYGVNPDIIWSDDIVAEMRAKRAQQMAAAQAAAAAPAMADTAKTMGDTNQANLKDVMGMFTGYGSPSAQDV